MLGGFAFLCILPQGTARRIEKFFDPANKLLRDWLAAIFSVGLTTLPLSFPPVAAADFGGFMLLLVLGFAATTATNAAIAAALAPRQSLSFDEGGAELATPDAGPPPKTNPFPATQQVVLVSSALLGAAAHLLLGSQYPILLTISLLATTLGSFSLASTLCSPTVKLWLHPFLTCAISTIAMCQAIGGASGIGWKAVLGLYAAEGGAGHLLARSCTIGRTGSLA